MSPQQAVEACSMGIVVMGVLLAVSRSVGWSILLVGAQSMLAGLAAIGVGLGMGADHLVVGGGLAILVKGVVLPAVMLAMLRGSAVRVERHPYLGRRTSLLAAVAIVFAASLITADVEVPLAAGGGRALPAAIAQVLTGLLLVLSRRKALSLLVGLLVFENGLALVAFALTYGMPLVVELGILFDLFIVVVVGWVYVRRMLMTFGTQSTDQLRTLRG
jgi:hydrogenase-4 component E